MVNGTREPQQDLHGLFTSSCLSLSHQCTSAGPQPLSFQRAQDFLGTFSCCCGQQVNTVPALSSKGLYNDHGLVPKFIKKKKRIYLQGKIVSALCHIFLHPYYLCLYNKYDKSRDRFSKIFSQLGPWNILGLSCGIQA